MNLLWKVEMYPETPLWTLLDNMQIPWTTAQNELIKQFGKKRSGDTELVVITSSPNLFKNEFIEVQTEILRRARLDAPAEVWILRVRTDDIERSFKNISSQLTQTLGKGSPSVASNATTIAWSFGTAKLSLSHILVDPLFGNHEPELMIIASPDFRPIATESEENALECANLIEMDQSLSTAFSIAFRARNREMPHIRRKLRTPFEGEACYLGIDKAHHFLYVAQGSDALMVALADLKGIALVTSIERGSTKYFVNGYLAENSRFDLATQIFLAASDKIEECKDIATKLAAITHLKITEEVHDNQY